MIYPNGDIEYCKGDTEVFRFNAKRDKKSCTLPVGDKYVLTVKRDKREITPIAIQKFVTIKEENQTYFDIKICKDDTKDCCCGEYVYDIRRVDTLGEIGTPLKVRKFKICEVIGTNV